MKERYENYLGSSHWNNIKKIKLNKQKKCELCGSGERLHIHHKHYESMNNEDLDNDLKTVCNSCHSLLHKMDTYNTDYIIILNDYLLDKIKQLKINDFRIFINSFNNIEKNIEIYGFSNKDINREYSKSRFVEICEEFGVLESYTNNSSYYEITFKDEFTFKKLKEYPFVNVNSREYLKLKNKGTLRMYELACKYKNQKFLTMKIDTFRDYFKIPASYKMCSIDKNILNKGILEIEAVTNTTIKIEKVKKGKEITHIKFLFGSRN